jgi:hypothetical protein
MFGKAQGLWSFFLNGPGMLVLKDVKSIRLSSVRARYSIKSLYVLNGGEIDDYERAMER